MEKIGELSLNFKDVPHPKKMKLGKHSWVPRTALRNQTVHIGQIIYSDKDNDIIQFVAMVGKKQVGIEEFVYKKDIQDDGNSNEKDREMDYDLVEANHYGGEDDGDVSEDHDSEGEEHDSNEDSLLFCRI